MEIGAIVQVGPNKGWIYCRTENGEPFLVSPKDSGVGMWQAAMNYASRQESELPSRDQLDAIYQAREIGAFKGTLNIFGATPTGWYWSSTKLSKFFVWSQTFNNGRQYRTSRLAECAIRLVRNCSAP